MDDRPKIVHFTFDKLTGFDIWREKLSLWREGKVSFVKKQQNANFNRFKVQFDTLCGHYIMRRCVGTSGGDCTEASLHMSSFSYHFLVKSFLINSFPDKKGSGGNGGNLDL